MLNRSFYEWQKFILDFIEVFFQPDSASLKHATMRMRREAFYENHLNWALALAIYEVHILLFHDRKFTYESAININSLFYVIFFCIFLQIFYIWILISLDQICTKYHYIDDVYDCLFMFNAAAFYSIQNRAYLHWMRF